jgi:hypothetical protein
MKKEMYLARCDSHYGERKTLIVKTHYSEWCHESMTVCWKCHYLAPVKQRLFGLWFKLTVKDVEPF